MTREKPMGDDLREVTRRMNEDAVERTRVEHAQYEVPGTSPTTKIVKCPRCGVMSVGDVVHTCKPSADQLLAKVDQMEAQVADLEERVGFLERRAIVDSQNTEGALRQLRLRIEALENAETPEEPQPDTQRDGSADGSAPEHRG